MKKSILLFFLIIALGTTGAMKAQETLTVYENATEKLSKIPMFVHYFGNFTKAQTVFPKSDLTAMVGGTITAITFYTTSDNIDNFPYQTEASADIYLKEVNDATISDYIDKSTATTVCTGTYNFVSDGNGGGKVTITFTTPYQYNGKNLLFGCENPSRGTGKEINFIGKTSIGSSISGQTNNSSAVGNIDANKRDFLPKTTFTYTYPQPANLQVGTVTYQSAALTWQAPATDVVNYSYSYKKHSASEWSSDYTTSSTQATLNGLYPGTEYEFRVKALYSGDYESEYATTNFNTAIITITAETPWTEDFENFYHTRQYKSESPNAFVWNNNSAYYMNDGCWDVVNDFDLPVWYWDSNPAFSGSGNVQFFNRGGVQILILPEFTNPLNTLQFEFKGDYYGSLDNQGTLEIGYCTYDDVNHQYVFSPVCTSAKITTPRSESNTSSPYMGPYPLTGDIPSGSRMALRYTPHEGAVVGQTTGFSAGLINLDDFRVSVPTKTITGVGAEHWNGNGGFYLIASPLAADVDPATVGMITNNDDAGYTYNLYYFDQAADKEWRSYAANSFDLVPGQGYLYASKGGTTLTFSGSLYSGNGQVTLSKTNGARFSGWNLVGNPFAQKAYIDGRQFYIINPEGRAEIIPAAVERNYVEPMEGIFVIAANDGETMTFSTTEEPVSSNQPQAFNVSLFKADIKANKLIDRAIVRFDECHGLPKFQLNPDHTKLYIPQGDKDFAVVHTQAEGELPLNLKVEENGRYTLSVDLEKVSVDYLHLIDNMTGADVDLLALRQAQGPASYTFSAKTTDYASRFKLVFAATGIEENPSTGSTTFAYSNGSEWVIANEGNATLQVVDMMGRVLSSETINGSCTKAINAAQGVYMLRLVNGENVKVQKIVVR